MRPSPLPGLLLCCALFCSPAGAETEAPANNAAAPNVQDYLYQPPVAAPAVAAQAVNDGANAKPAPVSAPQLANRKIENEFWYVLMLGGLCLASLAIVLYFLRARDSTARDMVNSAGLILITFGTIILVLVVNTSEQLTAATGILGAIAGYLFRSAQDDGKKAESPPPG